MCIQKPGLAWACAGGLAFVDLHRWTMRTWDIINKTFGYSLIADPQGQSSVVISFPPALVLGSRAFDPCTRSAPSAQVAQTCNDPRFSTAARMSLCHAAHPVTLRISGIPCCLGLLSSVSYSNASSNAGACQSRALHSLPSALHSLLATVICNLKFFRLSSCGIRRDETQRKTQQVTCARQ